MIVKADVKGSMEDDLGSWKKSAMKSRGADKHESSLGGFFFGVVWRGGWGWRRRISESDVDAGGKVSGRITASSPRQKKPPRAKRNGIETPLHNINI